MALYLISLWVGVVGAAVGIGWVRQKQERRMAELRTRRRYWAAQKKNPRLPGER